MALRGSLGSSRTGASAHQLPSLGSNRFLCRAPPAGTPRSKQAMVAQAVALEVRLEEFNLISVQA
jgi:hypothetical protein